MIILGLGLGITFQQVGNNCLSLDDAKREVEVSGVFFRDFFFFWRIIQPLRYVFRFFLSSVAGVFFSPCAVFPSISPNSENR